MTERMLPKISIVMPVLNRVKTIEKALRSVLDQGYPNLELIVIDGGSTDGTVAIIQRYENQIAYWHSQPDGGCAVATNMGIEKATGEYIALLMADDWYELGVLEKIGQAALKYPDADMLTCGGKIVVWDDAKQAYKPKHTYAGAKRMALTINNVCFDITSAICCRFVRQSLYHKIGLYIPLDAQGKHLYANDKEFLLRAIMAKAKDQYVDFHGHNYLASPDSASFGNHKANILRLCHEHMDFADTFLKNEMLTRRQRFLFRYWYHDQATRLVLYYMLDGQWQDARSVARKALHECAWCWPAAFSFTTVKILLKKIGRFMRSRFLDRREQCTIIKNKELRE